jgi:hypothetical protein
MARLTKMGSLRKQGLELDPTEDGANLFQHYGDFNTRFKEMLSMQLTLF